MAIEDSAVLAKLFGHLMSTDQVTSFLYAFQDLRQGRTKSMRVNELGNIYFMAMPDDAGGIQRDGHFKAQRDKGISPLEDDSGDASGLWESIKETWCYDAEDEADDWWVGWGMLRLRSLRGELKFGMEVQVSTRSPPSHRSPHLMRFPEYPAVFRVGSQVMTFFSMRLRGLGNISVSLCSLFLPCRFAVSAL